MDDQHYSVRGIRDFIQNLQQPLVYVVCAKCMWNRIIYKLGSVFNNDIKVNFLLLIKKLFCLNYYGFFG